MSNERIIAEYLRKLSPEQVASMFHGTYERLAPRFGYETRPETRKLWDELPEDNRKLMTATVKEIIDLLIVAEIGDEIGMP